MSNLPQTAHPANAGHGGNTSISNDFSATDRVPSHLLYRAVGKRSNTPLELDAPEYDPSIRKVWRALDETYHEFEKAYTWKSSATLGQMIPRYVKGVLTHYGERAIQEALNVLEQLGFIARVEMSVNGQVRKVIVMLWRICPITHGRGRLNFGGVEVDVDQLDPVRKFIAKPRVSLPPGSAQIHGPAAMKCAGNLGKGPETPQRSAPEYGIELRSEASNSKSSPIAPLGGEGTQPDPEPTPEAGPLEPSPPPVVLEPTPDPGPTTRPVPSAEAIAEVRATLATAQRRYPEFVAPELHILDAAGLESEWKAWTGGRPLPPLRAAEGAKPIRDLPASSSGPARPGPARSGPAGRPATTSNEPTVKLIFELVELADDQVERAIEIIANKLTIELVGGKYQTFVNRLRELRAGQITTTDFLDARRGGMEALPDPKRPDVMALRFNKLIRPHRPK